MPKLGPERPDHASDTRQLVERSRTESRAYVSARSLWIAFAAVLLAIVAFALILART